MTLLFHLLTPTHKQTTHKSPVPALPFGCGPSSPLSHWATASTKARPIALGYADDDFKRSTWPVVHRCPLEASGRKRAAATACNGLSNHGNPGDLKITWGAFHPLGSSLQLKFPLSTGQRASFSSTAFPATYRSLIHRTTGLLLSLRAELGLGQRQARGSLLGPQSPLDQLLSTPPQTQLLPKPSSALRVPQDGWFFA